MKLTTIGCGDAFGSEGRYNTSFLLSDDQLNVLVDCGASTLLRLKQLNLSPESIDVIVITHFHGDHYGGIPFLMISNKMEYQRTRPLKIIGPKGIEENVYGLQDALYPGTSKLFNEMNVSFHEYADELQEFHEFVEVKGLTVTHSLDSNPHGVQIRIKDKLFGFSGDTEWNDHLLELSKDTDLFVIECNNLHEDSPGHLSYKTIQQRQNDFQTKRLLLTHMGSEVINAKNLEVDRLYDGLEIDF